MYCWLMLFLAVLTEVFGTTLMGAIAPNNQMAAHLVIVVSIGLSYYFLGKAMHKIPMGVSFAVWEGAGIAAITFLGWLCLGEVIGLSKLLGIALIACGVAFLEGGAIGGHADEEEKKIIKKSKESFE